ncbi:purine-nucleoside phosphorylase [Spirosomataceae bacterium TFI 002]|nr:purine-nucleoside phosphorylase [Spirosomataceae bacterium TFI 002]
MIQKLKKTQSYINKKTKDFAPQVGIILGTGLDQLVDKIDIKYELSYGDLPHFPVSTVSFHAGKLIFGYLGGKPVVCMKGRFHYYEGYSMQEVAYPVRVMKLLGIQQLLISNAAGGLNPDYKESDLMLIEDHISLLLPTNPLIGENIMGERFPDMSEPYDLEMLNIAEDIVKEHGIANVRKGVYISLTGPQLETKAEYRMIRNMGADAVGMSTVPETIVAVQMGIPAFAVSIITDICIPETLQKAEIEKIIAAAGKAEPTMTLLFEKLIEKL